MALIAQSALTVDEPWTSSSSATYPTPHPAPYLAIEVTLSDQAPPGRILLELSGQKVKLTCWYDASRGSVGLEVQAGGQTTSHRSRRHGRPAAPVEALGLALTGTHLSVLTREVGRWVVRGRVDLSERFDTRVEPWLATLTSSVRWNGVGFAPFERVRAGGFGQLGLRDIRLVSHADGTPYLEEGRVLMTATSAGPGYFDTAHTSVWELDLATLDLTHRADLFFRRPDRPGVFGDHATHLVRDGDRWLVATSTWGDFDSRRKGASVAVTLAESRDDLLSGRHVLDTRTLSLPTDELRSVGVWDPHLLRHDGGWLVGFVSAPKFFHFHPALAFGPTLDKLTLKAAAHKRLATEGTTLVQLDGTLRVLASDGREGREGQRRRFPIFDLDLNEIGSLDAPYPTNIPWPTLIRTDRGWLMIAFNGVRYGGDLVAYGTHGEVVFARAALAPD